MNTDSFEKTRDDITQISASAFAEHVLTEEAGRWEWRVGKPGTGTYAFFLLCRPGMVAVWGDLGEWILRHGNKDSLGWLRGAVHSPDYLIGKVKAGDTTEFYPVDAMAQMDRMIEEGDTIAMEVKRDLQHRITNDLPTEEEWHRAWAEAGADPDHAPFAKHPASGALWLVESLRLFVKLEAASNVLPTREVAS